MNNPKTWFFLLISFLLASTTTAMASQCIDCHTNADKLKAIAQTLPKPEVSAETAGKG